MKSIITCPFIPISWKMSSHRAAQALIYVDELRQQGEDVTVNWSGKITDYTPYDRAYFYHGNDMYHRAEQLSKYMEDENTTMGVNLFGDVVLYPYSWNVAAFFRFPREVVSLGIPMPRYDLFIQKKIRSAQRRGKEVLQDFLDLPWDNMERICTQSPFVKFPIVNRKLVIGDSHAICMYRPGWTVHSIPFKTLHGALNTGLLEFVKQVGDPHSFDEIELYFGNIDNRHHLWRQPDPLKATEELAFRYALEALNLSATIHAKVSIYELLPIEAEHRKIPTTGKYKGANFAGTWAQRNESRLLFRDTIEKSGTGIPVIRWTDYLLNMEGELDFKFMEEPHSIHLSREFYPFWQGEAGPNPNPGGKRASDQPRKILEKKKEILRAKKELNKPKVANLEDFMS